MSQPQQVYVDDRQDLWEEQETDGPLGSQRIRVSKLFLHLCVQVVDHLASCYSVWPFMLPVPSTAIVYHREIKTPMDLLTLEKKVYRGYYKNFGQFQDDLVLIWKNAQRFHHDPTASIHRMANDLEQRYGEFMQPLFNGRSIVVPERTTPTAEETDLSLPMFTKVSPESPLYFMQLTLPKEKVSKNRILKGYSNVSDIYDQLNGGFYRAVDAIKQGHPLPQRPLQRIYISKNRTLLLESQSKSNGVIAIFTSVELKPYTSLDERLTHVTGDVALVRPLGKPVDFDISNADSRLSTEFLPKAWMKVKIVKVIPGVQAVITLPMKKALFYRPYATHRISNNRELRTSASDIHLTRLFTRAVLDGKTSLNDASTYQVPADVASSFVSSIKRKSSPSTSVSQASTASSLSSSSVSSPTSSQQQFEQIKRRMIDESPSSSSTTLQHHQQTPSPNFDQQVPILSRFSSVDDNPQHPVTPPESQQNTQSLSFTKYLDSTNDQSMQVGDEDENREYYINQSKQLWEKVLQLCDNKDVPIIHVNKYLRNTTSFPNAEGYFKHVYYVQDDPSVVVQTFRRMTITQRATELVTLLAVHNIPHMAQILEVLKEDNGEIIGLSMERYQKTLKQYTHKHSHHRLTAYQKMDIIQQLLVCMREIHALGIAHRDLSEVNFMVNESKEQLKDGSPRANVYLIDFGKAIFTKPEDVRQWWVDRPPLRNDEYEGEVLPENLVELDKWCDHLPWVRCKPDHGYRHYRSIQTLPRTRIDQETLPYLVHPIAEDIYSIGTLIWKTFADSEPWYGILDTDLRGLRERVQSDYTIDAALDREVSGELSRELLRFCLRASPEDRKSADEVLEWVKAHEQELIDEWIIHAPQGRTRRHAKVFSKFEDEQTLPQQGSRKGKSRKSKATPGKKEADTSSTTTNDETQPKRKRGRPKGSFKKNSKRAKAAAEAAALSSQQSSSSSPIPMLAPTTSISTNDGAIIPQEPMHVTTHSETMPPTTNRNMVPGQTPVSIHRHEEPLAPSSSSSSATLIRLPSDYVASRSPSPSVQTKEQIGAPSSTVIRLPSVNTRSQVVPMQSRYPNQPSSRGRIDIPSPNASSSSNNNATQQDQHELDDTGSASPTIRLLLSLPPPPSSSSSHQRS
ncbi:hypothetical protein K492DRAFT_206425 [Lichtheimia hyalospora FSU 10163]|nr:hypothetical protein K492DRAFT_206425 [Lichtheimia hyalospora FSU 10163]